MAAYRLGHQVLTMELVAGGSSLSKGETLVDTVLNVAAMNPDVMVVRYGRSPELDLILEQLPMPVVNAGSGSIAHPTQGLLDAYTIFRERGGFVGQRVLIVGDIRYSRVARSNFDILQKLGAEVAVCGPEKLLPSAPMEGVRFFSDLDEATRWCSVYMGLRIQLERHEAHSLNLESQDDYHQQFGLTKERLRILAKDAMIMHPGPINHGVEFCTDVMNDPRSAVLKQVANGVLIRGALLKRILNEGNGQ